MALSILTMICSHHCYLLCFQSISWSQREILYPLNSNSPSANPWEPLFYCPSIWICLFQGSHTKRNHAVFVLLCLASFSWGFPSSSIGKESACNTRDPISIPGSGRSPVEGNGNCLQYYCLENSTDRGPGGLHSMGSKESDMTATHFPFPSFP